MIKVYDKGVIGQYMLNTSINDVIQMRGPYAAWRWQEVQHQYTHVAMIAAGSGITSMYQVCKCDVDMLPMEG